MHDPDLRPLARLHGRRKLLVEGRPVDGVVLDLDVLVLSAEVLDQLLHRRTVTAGEAVPVGQGQGCSGVLARELLTPAGLRGGAGALSAAAGAEQDGRAAAQEEPPTADGRCEEHGVVLAHWDHSCWVVAAVSWWSGSRRESDHRPGGVGATTPTGASGTQCGYAVMAGRGEEQRPRHDRVREGVDVLDQRSGAVVPQHVMTREPGLLPVRVRVTVARSTRWF